MIQNPDGTPFNPPAGVTISVDGKDARPDVEIRSAAWANASAKWLTYTAACRWCPESLLTPDVRNVVKWADAHEMSLSHTHTKDEALAEGRGPRDPWAVL